MSLNINKTTSVKLLVILALIMGATFRLNHTSPVAAACASLPTDKGIVTSTITIPADGTYRVWSRIFAPDANNNSYYLEVDDTICGVVAGDNAIAANSWTWVDYQAGNTASKTNLTLTAGTHTIRRIGREDGVKVDRLIFATDTACVPTGTGDNCLSSTSTTTGINYFVNPISGSDANPGTAATAPLKLIQTALNKVKPGDTINLATGTYREKLTTVTNGTATAPITIKGPETGKDQAGRYKAILYGASRIVNVDHSYYTFDGFTIDGQEALANTVYPTALADAEAFKNSVTPLVKDGRLIYVGSADTTLNLTGIVIRNMFLSGAGGECIRIRNLAHDNEIADSVIQYCGLFGKVETGKYTYHNGEGVYIGTSPSSTTQPQYANDSSNNIYVHDNKIHTFGSECLDVKENAHDVRFENNDCGYNDEPLANNGSNIELRSYRNSLKGNVITQSRGYGLKMWTDSGSYQTGGNSAENNNFSTAAGVSITNKQATAQGSFCGNTFDSANVLYGPLPGDPKAACPTTPGADTAAPTGVVMSVPASPLSGSVTLSSIASDNVGVSKVEFYKGTSLIGTSTAPASGTAVNGTWQLVWDTKTVADGTYTLASKAYDASGNGPSASATVSVTIKNTVTPVNTAPTTPTGVTASVISSNQINLAWTASIDDAAVTGYDIYRNGVLVATINSTSYGDTGLAAATEYSYTVVARDGAGLSSSASAPVSATTATAPPVSHTSSFEAESGVITAPMVVASDAAASGGKYIVQTTTTSNGTASYDFTVDTTGNYQLTARVIAPNSSSNSVYYSIDGASYATWDIPSGLKNWTWVGGPTKALSQGSHKLVIKRRENNTKLDAFAFNLKSTITTTAVTLTTPFEAEVGTATGGLTVNGDATASGGKYVLGSSTGNVSYTLNVPVAGKYMVAGYTEAKDSSSNSFNVKMDSGSNQLWDLLQPKTTWTYDADSNPIFDLSAGLHTFTLSYREPNAKVDRIVFLKQ